jgi:uncharacterized membrane protein YfcA
MFTGLEDQLTIAIASAVSFAAGWILDNNIPRKIAGWLIGLVVTLLLRKSPISESKSQSLTKRKRKWRSLWRSSRQKKERQ